jgi:hypothetical protein
MKTTGSLLQHLGLHWDDDRRTVGALLSSAEKRLYDAGTSEAEIGDGYEDLDTPDYANAAATLARSKGISDNAISGALASVTGGVGAADERAGAAGRDDAAVEAAHAGAGARGQGAARAFTPAAREAFLARYASLPARDLKAIISSRSRRSSPK